MEQSILKNTNDQEKKKIPASLVVAQTIATVFWVAAAFWTVKKAMS